MKILLFIFLFVQTILAQSFNLLLMNDGRTTGEILTDSLKAYWAMSDTSDSHSNNELTNVGVSFVTGKVGNCGDFEATENDYMSIADNASLSMGDIDMTIAAWFKLESTGDYLPIAGKYGAPDTREYLLFGTQVDCTPDAASFLASSDGAAITYQCDATAENTNWHFVVGWHNKTTDSIYIQLDNGTIYQSAFAGGIINSTSPFEIGIMLQNNDYDFDGLIDEVAVWKRVLTQAERDYLYNSGSGRTYSSGKIQ